MTIFKNIQVDGSFSEQGLASGLQTAVFTDENIELHTSGQTSWALHLKPPCPNTVSGPITRLGIPADETCLIS